MANAQSKFDNVASNVISQFSQAQKQAEFMFATQKVLLDTLEQMNAHWFARAKSEAELTTELTSKLVSARSIPDLASAYQDWFSQRMRKYAEDSNHVFVDVQKLMRTSVRFVQNGHSGVDDAN
jgi:hypothetical protein